MQDRRERRSMLRPLVLLSASNSDRLYAYGVRVVLERRFDVLSFIPRANGMRSSKATLWVHVDLSSNQWGIRVPEFRHRYDDLPVIGIGKCGTDDPSGTQAVAQKAGIAALLDASCGPNELLEAAEQARLREPAEHAASTRKTVLTHRQQEVLRRIAQGLQNKEIAVEMGVSVKTVEFHRGRLMQRAGVHSVAGLTRLALDLDLLPLWPASAQRNLATD